MASSVSSSSGKDTTSKGKTKRGHYGNYLSQPNAKIPKTTFYRMLNKSKSAEDNDQETLSSVMKGMDDEVIELSNHPVQLSSFLNESAEILDDSGDPTCSQGARTISQTGLSRSVEVEQPTDREELDFKAANTTLDEAQASIVDDITPWNFPDVDDPAIDMEQRQMNFAFPSHEENILDDIWSVEEEFETSDESSTETSQETDGSSLPLFEGARLTLGASMLLVITFAMRHSITGVALADLLLLIEVHLISPNCFGHSMKLIRNFFKQLKNPIEYHFYCSFCFEYIGVNKSHSGHCPNKHCLQDFTKKGSLAYFIIIPFITQLQALLANIILQPTPAITYRTIGGILDFYVFLGPTPDLVVQQFTAVVGRPFMPPYWGLGFHLCRWGYGSLNGTITVNENMRKYGIPQDVQWNDIEYMDRHLDFTINQSNWGGLGDFVKKLHDTFHQRYIPIVDPGISSTQPQGSYPPFDVGLQMGIFINSSNGQTFIGRVWPGLTAFPDFTYSVTQAYWEQMLSQFRNLVEYDGLWIDMNEPSNQLDGSPNGCLADSPLDHPPYATHVSGTNLYSKTVCMSAKHHDYSHYDVHSLYGLTEMEKTMSALRKLRGKRSVVISRSTFPSAGLHGGHWLGDNTATFNDLYLSIPGILNFNLFGVPLVGADICGFNGNTNKDLCARWTQLGAFYPFSRNHNTLNAASQDPAAFGPEFASMARDVLMARYMLLPYMYTLFAQAHTLGSAVARPLFYEFPTDRATHVIDRQFLLGPALLITPVLTEGSTSVQGYFPDATWYDGTDGSILQTSGGGGQMHTLQAPWDKIHFHFRGGYVIPTQQPDITTYQSRQKPFGLIVALSSTGEASGGLFYDDGESLDPIISAPYLYIHYTVTKGTMKAQVDSKSSYHPEPSLSTIRMLGVSAGPSSVTVNGDPIHSFSFDSSTKVLSIGNLTLPMDKDFTVIWS